MVAGLILTAAGSALSGIVGNRADALVMRMARSPDRTWLEQAARIAHDATDLDLSPTGWTDFLDDPATWPKLVQLCADLSRSADETPDSARQLAALLPPTPGASEAARVDAVCFLALAVLSTSSPEVKAALALAPALRDLLGLHLDDREAVARRRRRRALPLRAPTVRPPHPDRKLSPASLLVADFGMVPFLDRGNHCQALQAWCAAPDPMAVAVVSGEGGAGKTRLARELCLQLRRFPAVASRRWVAGYFDRATDPSQLEALADDDGPRLVVVDYAEAVAPDVAGLVSALHGRASRIARARVLLLIRHGTGGRSLAGSPWPWLDRQSDLLREYLVDAVTSGSWINLDQSPLTLDERVRLFGTSARAFAAHEAVEWVDHPPPTWLEDGPFRSPLLVGTAALDSVLGGQVPTRPPAAAELFDSILSHESRYWAALPSSTQLDDTEREQAVALATLFRPSTTDETIRTLRLIDELSDEPQRVLRSIARWLAELYPPQGEEPRLAGGVGAVQPDRLGEALVARFLAAPGRDPVSVLASGLAASTPTSVLRCLEVLSRTVPPRPELLGLLRRFAAELPALRQLAPPSEQQDGEGWRDHVISGAQGLTARLEEAGQVEVATEMAEQLARFAAGTSSVPDHAQIMALTTLANRLAGAGRADDAVSIATQAVSVARDVAAQTPDVESAALAGAEIVLGLRQLEAGQPAAAATSLGSAVSRYRRLVGNDLVRWGDDLALALNNHAVALHAAGETKAAVDALKEVVSRHEAAASAGRRGNPLTLAAALLNLSNRLDDLGEMEAAVEASATVVGLYTEIVDSHDREVAGFEESLPSPQLGELGGALGNLALRQLRAGDVTNAVTTSARLVDLVRAAAKRRHLPESDLWSALQTRADILSAADRLPEALLVREEAHQIIGRLAATSPEEWLDHLARSEHDLAIALFTQGEAARALDVADLAWNDMLRAAELELVEPESLCQTAGLALLYRVRCARPIDDLDRLAATSLAFARPATGAGTDEPVHMLVTWYQTLAEVLGEIDENQLADAEVLIRHGAEALITARRLDPDAVDQAAVDRLLAEADRLARMTDGP